jgi:hypothetical protein
VKTSDRRASSTSVSVSGRRRPSSPARSIADRGSGPPGAAIAAAALGVLDEAQLARVVTAAFTKRRKQLRNALAEVIAHDALRALGIDPQLRPENLAVADYVAIANAARG